MKRIATLFFLILGTSVAALAQDPPKPAPVSTFSTNLTAISLPGSITTATGTLSGVNLGVSQNFSLHETNLVSPGNVTGFYGGADYTIAPFSKWLNNRSPQLNGYDFRLQVTASIGVDRITDANGLTKQHWSGMAGGRLSYAVHGSKTFGVAVEVQAARLPGYSKGWTPLVAVGPVIHF